jgi:hypothetical protein
MRVETKTHACGIISMADVCRVGPAPGTFPVVVGRVGTLEHVDSNSSNSNILKCSSSFEDKNVVDHCSIALFAMTENSFELRPLARRVSGRGVNTLLCGEGCEYT